MTLRRQILAELGEVNAKIDAVLRAQDAMGNQLEGIMTESQAVEAATAQVETDVTAINAGLATINTSLTDLIGKINGGGQVTAADLAALQQSVTDLGTATSGVTATAATAAADDPGPTPSA